MKTKNETWVIRHKVTKQHWKTRSGKSSWNKPAHAKNAWSNTYQSEHSITEELKPFYKGTRPWDKLYFQDQDIYEIVDVNEEYITSKSRLEEGEKAIKMLEEIREGLYGHGFEVANFHLNGDLEPLDKWFEDNGWV